MKKSLVIMVSLSMLLLSGCATKSAIEKRGFAAEGLSITMPGELIRSPNNPAVIANIRSLSDGTNASGYAGSRMGDIGRFAQGGDLPSMVVGVGVGVVAAGVGAVTGMFKDVKVQAEGKKRPELYEVMVTSAYYLDPKSPLPVPEKLISHIKRHGQREAYIVYFDRKDVKYQDQDVVVLKETKEKIAGRRVYRAIDIFDAKAGDTNSVQFLARMQDIARKAGVNKRVALEPVAVSQ